ncbi:MAG: twin-arginine translocase TatA/TatE family subunit [Actinomycetota bacterium]
MNFGPPEILLVVGAIALLFGAKKFPEVARSLGKAKGEFKKGLKEGDAEAHAPEPADAEVGSEEAAKTE